MADAAGAPVKSRLAPGAPVSLADLSTPGLGGQHTVTLILRALRSLRVALWVLLLAAASGSVTALAACEAVTPVQTVARRIVQPDGAPLYETVPLPDHLPLAQRSEQHRIAYRIDVTPCAAGPLAALWLFRVGAPYVVRDELGRALPMLSGGASSLVEPLIAGLQPEGGPHYNGRIPALFSLPPGTRVVEVTLTSLPYLPAGLVRAEVGPAHLLLAQQSRQLDQVVAFADAASGVVLVLGAMALVLWLQRRSDRALLWLAVACFIWGVRGLVYFGPRVMLPPLVFEQFNPGSVVLASAAVTASVLALLGRVPPRAWQALAVITVGASGGLVMATAVGSGGLAMRAVALGSGFVMLGSLLVHVWRRRRQLAYWQLATLLVALSGLVVCAFHDMAVVTGRLPPHAPSWVFWGFVAMLIGFAAMSGQYVVATLNRAERSNEELERHVLRKSYELEQSYALLRESERETARTQERERLLRDMHDGLGAQLMTALRGVERGALTPVQVSQSLQDSLDELRLLMDSTDIGLYLPGALAAWRNRWDHRLAAAGVALQWQIDESLDAVQLPGDSALQVMRILQEAATNIVKHAQARHMRLDARVAADAQGKPELQITITDDGVGLPTGPARAGARGLKNMQHRATQIGATLVTRGGGDAPGTTVVLRVPLGIQRAMAMAVSGPEAQGTHPHDVVAARE